MRAHPVAFVMSLVVGFALSQAPELARQYQQRLDSAINELQRVIQQSGYDRTAALQPMAGNTDQRVRDQASRMDEVFGIFPTPFMRARGMLGPPMVARLVEAFTAVTL